ncbi:MAG: hypothetical protein OWQ52_00605 [Metallosphaera prunae]|uniref:hypothetical protein n=1 Tax=Metallosphaera prunae TaxID=47304 RepID=UPI00227575D4|nr:hypothetical protein [Metallosphaera prunae]MCY0860915.1 hypothetical protein [Metallosphaera prunae]
MLKILIFEGFDGVGKTTLAKKLSEKWGFNYIHFPLKGDPSFYPKETFLQEMYNEMMEKYLHWRMLTPLYIDQVKYVVVDRWALSTLLYNNPKGQMRSMLLDLLRPIPGTYFYYFLMSDDREETKIYIKNCHELLYEMLEKNKDLDWVYHRTIIHHLKKENPGNLLEVEKTVGLIWR